MIIPYQNISPKIDPSVLIAAGAFIIGDVEIGKDSSIWFNVVVRGDVNYIRIGERTNIQDLTMVHVTYKKFPTFIGNDVSIGHSAVIHGCRINDHVVIGMGAKILDDALVSSNSMVAAGSVVKERFIVPEGTLVAGVPAKVVRDLRPEEIEKIHQNAKNYLYYIEQYRKYNDGKGFQQFK
ncbi:MAG: gamma carbonic anhydrase family protein [Ignavibacteriae bacterium]|nr:MAG: gamma carbonic anhydrase family protein [Ignavibacteriota bacterium]